MNEHDLESVVTDLLRALGEDPTRQGLLRTPGRSITDIALLCGFADQAHMTRVFTSVVGTSPGAWRREHGA